MGVYIRPFAQKFLQSVSKKFEIIVFTASRQDYADKIISILDPSQTILKEGLYRQNCVPYKGICMKDFGVIKNRKKEDLIMIDNFLYSFALDFDNGIAVKSYLGEREDRELEFLASKLLQLKGHEDTRVWIKKTFKTESFYKYLRESSF
jgi:CTD small phosphatase-like protein 2